MNTLPQCPICLSRYVKPIGEIQNNFDNGSYYVNCPACGQFTIPQATWDDHLDPQTGAGSKLDDRFRAAMSYKIRNSSSKTKQNFSTIPDQLIYDFVKSGCTGPTPAVQALNLIRFIGDNVSETGRKIDILPAYFYAIIGSSSPAMAGELVNELNGRSTISGKLSVNFENGYTTIRDVNLTLEGWE